MRRLVKLRKIFVLFILAAGPSAVHADAIRDLGAGVTGLFMNNSGDVAGLRPDPDGRVHATPYWPSTYTTTYRGFFARNGQVTPLAPDVLPVHVTSDGRVINGNDVQYPGSGTPAHTVDGFHYFLAQQPGAANDSGQMVGTGDYTTHPLGQLTVNQAGYVYTPIVDQSSAPGVLGTFGKVWVGSTYNVHEVYPNAINNSGLVAGGFLYEPTADEAKAGMPWSVRAFIDHKDLGNVIPGTNSQINVLNDAGDAAGYSNAIGAFLYKDGKVITLGNFDPMGINPHDQIVGGSTLYDPIKGTTIDLNSLLPSGSGWSITDARAINDNGQVLGYGMFNGESHGFLLNLNASIQPVPEPTTLIVFGLATVACGVLRSRGRFASGRGPRAEIQA